MATLRRAVERARQNGLIPPNGAISVVTPEKDGLTVDDNATAIAFRLAGQHPSKTADLLGEERICVYSGDNYAYEYFTAAGLRDSGGAVRAGIYHYTTREEVDRLLDAVMRCR